MSEFTTWLPPLDPPPGGYARLADALQARRERAARHAWRGRLAWVGASIAVVFMVLTPLLRVPPAQRQQEQRIAASLEQAWALGDQEIVVSDGAAAEILKAPGLRVYWVGVVGEPADPASSERQGTSEP
jgi:hypothetical protein